MANGYPGSSIRLLAVWLLSSLLFIMYPHPAASQTDFSSPGSIRTLLIPKNETTLSSELAGVLKSIEVDFGERFKKGQSLFELDCSLYDGEVNKAAATVLEAEKTLEVNKKLEQLQSVSALEVAISEARLQGARAEHALRTSLQDKCIVYAPFSGRVAKKLANRGQYLASGQPVLEIIEDSTLLAQLFVPSIWLRWLKPGQSFTITIDETGERYAAQVTMLAPSIDQVSQSIEVRAAIAEPGKDLLAGMSGTASFQVPGGH